MKMCNLKVILIIFLFLTNCQTIKNKSDEIIKKENETLSKFIGKPVSELRTLMGNPDEDYKNEKNETIFVYKTKKYGIPCERKFVINEKNVVLGFNSKGCF